MTEIIAIITTITAIATLLFGIYHFKKKNKLQEKVLDLQAKMLELQKEQAIKKELEPSKKEYEKQVEKSGDLQVYCEYIQKKYRYLDFTGLNAILQKPLLLEKVYVKLRAQESFFPELKTIKDYRKLEKFEEEEDSEKTKNKTRDFIDLFSEGASRGHKKKGATEDGDPGSTWQWENHPHEVDRPPMPDS